MPEAVRHDVYRVECPFKSLSLHFADVGGDGRQFAVRRKGFLLYNIRPDDRPACPVDDRIRDPDLLCAGSSDSGD
jgi:hypothetical protein